MPYFEDALKMMREQNLRVKRASWKRSPQWIMMVDPRIYPTVDGDTSEYNVFVRSIPSNPQSVPISVKKDMATKAEAEEFVKSELEATKKITERYIRYTELVKLRSAGPLDYAEKPRFSIEQLEGAWVANSAKPSSRRLGKPYIAAMATDNTLEIYTLTMEDLAADDWRVA